jgi:hypothetical protein
MSMKSLIVLAAAAALAVTATPALAKSKKKHVVVHPGYYAAEQYAPYPAWTTRNVADPSFGNRGAINYARSLGRCVEDLGYGRYKYCGW